MSKINVVDVVKFNQDSMPGKQGTARLRAPQDCPEKGPGECEEVERVIRNVLITTARVWAEKHPGSVVMERSQALAVGEHVDITPELITVADSIKPLFADCGFAAAGIPGTE